MRNVTSNSGTNAPLLEIETLSLWLDPAARWIWYRPSDLAWVPTIWSSCVCDAFFAGGAVVFTGPGGFEMVPWSISVSMRTRRAMASHQSVENGLVASTATLSLASRETMKLEW